jgi:hypothetical protein
MVDHYARLLGAAGWTAAAASSDSTSAAQLFRARDQSGSAWQGVLWGLRDGEWPQRRSRDAAGGTAMRSSRRAVAAMLALSCMACARTASAQGREPATIPTALATAVLSPFFGMFGDRPHSVVGRTPEGWPKNLHVPASAALVGGVSLGPFCSAVYRYPRRDDAVEAFQRVLADAGFTRSTVGRTERGGLTLTTAADRRALELIMSRPTRQRLHHESLRKEDA